MQLKLCSCNTKILSSPKIFSTFRILSISELPSEILVFVITKCVLISKLPSSKNLFIYASIVQLGKLNLSMARTKSFEKIVTISMYKIQLALLHTYSCKIKQIIYLNHIVQTLSAKHYRNYITVLLVFRIRIYKILIRPNHRINQAIEYTDRIIGRQICNQN